MLGFWFLLKPAELQCFSFLQRCVGVIGKIESKRAPCIFSCAQANAQRKLSFVALFVYQESLRQPCPECGARSQAFITKIIGRIMQRRRLFTISEPNEAARLELQEVGKIFASRYQGAFCNIALASQFACYRRSELGFFW
ncbi:hypothetical protein A3753_24185 [Sulfitobacter sp. HI0082]|nr:hypothetical protein A3753_24185 [Sulfitobacter sp. HI0082]